MNTNLPPAFEAARFCSWDQAPNSLSLFQKVAESLKNKSADICNLAKETIPSIAKYCSPSTVGFAVIAGSIATYFAGKKILQKVKENPKTAAAMAAIGISSYFYGNRIYSSLTSSNAFQGLKKDVSPIWNQLNIENASNLKDSVKDQLYYFGTETIPGLASQVKQAGISSLKQGVNWASSLFTKYPVAAPAVAGTVGAAAAGFAAIKTKNSEHSGKIALGSLTTALGGGTYVYRNEIFSKASSIFEGLKNQFTKIAPNFVTKTIPGFVTETAPNFVTKTIPGFVTETVPNAYSSIVANLPATSTIAKAAIATIVTGGMLVGMYKAWPQPTEAKDDS